MPKITDALKNEYVKSLILLAVIIGFIAVFWIGFRTYLRTDYPILAVASGSMMPTLHRGDLIIVEGGLNVSDIIAAGGTGDIVVFHKPGSREELIVHRAVEKTNGGLKTKGDNNIGVDPWTVYDTDLVGKVIWIVPYLGHVPLFVHTPTGMTIIIILIAVLILLEFIIPLAREKKEPEQAEPPEDVDDFSDIGLS